MTRSASDSVRPAPGGGPATAGTGMTRDSPPSPRVVVLQHLDWESPGLYLEVLREHNATCWQVELDQGDILPEDLSGVDALLVMGGPMSANEEERHPWLSGEKRLLASAVSEDIPVFGVCLGAQLLAASLGARVYRGGNPEVGVLPLSTSAAAGGDPVFSVLPQQFLAFQWHDETFDLPRGAVRLASSETYPNQAFRIGCAAYGLQFHLEVTPAMMSHAATVPEYAAALAAIDPPLDFDGLSGAFTAASETLADYARQLFGRWLTNCVDPAGRRAREPS